MAGHKKVVYPDWVKPPSGGWFHTPKNHHLNGMIALGLWGIAVYVGYLHGEANTYNPRKQYTKEDVKRWNDAARIANQKIEARKKAIQEYQESNGKLTGE